MAEIQYDPACVDCRHDAAKDAAGTTWQCTGHVRAERGWLRARLANVMAEADHDISCLTTERNAALTLAEQRGTAYDITRREVESLRERLDQYDAYDITVASALYDREQVDVMREALREIAQHPCWLTKMGYTMTCENAKAVGACSPCRARAALAASEAKEVGR